MANIIENAKQIKELRETMQAQLNAIREHLKSFSNITTSTGTVLFRLSDSTDSKSLHFVITMNGEKLYFHYDLTLDEFIIDDCRVTFTFRVMQFLLSDVEIFLRKVLNMSDADLQYML